MPIYEFICQRCNQRVELLMRSGGKPVCPQCGSKRLSRQFSTFAAHQGGSSSATPCQAGQCPAAAGARAGCASGGCPFA